ncbi:MAG: YuiB family protein [Bacillota bacterium]|nr:YuiB family protein [Bacillota bacterium]
MQMSIGVLIISVLLFFVLFFGIGFLLNMILRMTWIMTFFYPIIAILIVDKVRFIQYFTNTNSAFHSLVYRFSTLGMADIIILSSGFAGAIGAGITMKLLRKSGYQMF